MEEGKLNLKNFKFTEDHEWVKCEGNISTIGITDYAQKELGDVVYVELPTPGDTIKKGDTCSNIESVKAVSDIYAPVSGEITEINKTLDDQPEKVNQDPYGEGWLFKIKINNQDEIEALIDEEKYNDYLKGISEE